MDWMREKPHWPFADSSRFVTVRPHRWHVQSVGHGPDVICLHGAGGATQSWRALAPLLAKDMRLILVDLPGQGFTDLGARSRCGLDPMAQDLLSLAESEGWEVSRLMCHSAGTAIALRMAELRGEPLRIFGINGALGSFEGMAGWLFPIMAKAMALNPLTARFVAATMTRGSVKRLLRGTGSDIDATGAELYFRLASDAAHVDGTLAMMAQWNLNGLLSRLEKNPALATLATSSGDKAVPPGQSMEAARRLPGGQHLDLGRYGHLVHEEAAQIVAPHVKTALLA